jgi:hypothetical protein
VIISAGPELEYTVNWFFSPEGAQAANDRVVQLMDRLELPNLYRRIPSQLHTSSDGQKFEVHADSLNANYSFKYFGKYQGVSVYTFLFMGRLMLLLFSFVDCGSRTIFCDASCGSNTSWRGGQSVASAST